jgi:hypothetical protein
MGESSYNAGEPRIRSGDWALVSIITRPALNVIPDGHVGERFDCCNSALVQRVQSTQSIA